MTGRTGRAAPKALAALAALAVLAVAAGCATPGTARRAPAAHSPRAAVARQGPATAAASCDPYTSSLAPNGPASVTPGSFAETIRKRGYLIAGVDQSTYHFGFQNPIDNKLEGFDIDMVDAVSQAIFGPGYQSHIEFKAIPDSGRIPALQTGAVDIVAHTMTITCDRLQQIDFSSVYYSAKAELLVLKSSAARSLAGLKGQKVCATKGSDDPAIIARYGAVPVQTVYWTDCLVDLQQGQVAGVVTDDSILHGLAAQDPFTKVIPRGLENEPYGLGIARSHPDFVRFVNAVIAQMESDGQWEKSYAKWVGGPAQPPPPLRYAP